jgi:putative ABC transport system substrate-binding protein
MAPAGDPVGTGLISSLARPGGNITGLSSTTAELGAKTLELIRDELPSTRRVAVLANADPFSRPFSELIEDGGRTLGIAIQTIKVRRVEEFDAANPFLEAAVNLNWLVRNVERYYCTHA